MTATGQVLSALVGFVSSFEGATAWFMLALGMLLVSYWSDWSGASIILLASLGSYLLLSPYKVELWNRSESALLILALETWRRKAMEAEGMMKNMTWCSC